jgi:neutral ceramidase
MKRLTGPIRAAYREIPLAYDTLPTKEQLLEEQKSTNKWQATHATRVLQRIADEGPLKPTYPYPVQVVRLGNDLTWVTLGGEVVVDYSLRLKQDIKDPIVWVSGYTNDVMAYIPSLRIWQEGGYEGGGAMIYGTHPTRWSDKTEEHIVNCGTVMTKFQSSEKGIHCSVSSRQHNVLSSMDLSRFFEISSLSVNGPVTSPSMLM